jgi:hypothetical protein
MNNLHQRSPKPKAPMTSRRSRASALMLVIWAIMLMSFTVGSTVKYISYSAKESGLAANRFRALHLAECGAEIAFLDVYLPPLISRCPSQAATRPSPFAPR